MISPLVKEFALVLWLLPAAPARQFYRQLIARLAAECDAPLFEPHLTLGLRRNATERLEPIAAQPIELRVLGIDTSDKFSKTLFVRLKTTPELQALRDSLGVEILSFDPHVSLLYKNLPPLEKTRLASSITLPFACTSFDLVQMVRCPSPTVSRADVEAWQVIASEELK
jgi:hypothetical protein